jgi:hypothetical protein
MSKLFTKLSNFAIWGYAAFGVLVWVFNQFGVDVLAIIEHSTVNAGFYGTTGGLIGVAKTAQIVVKTILTKYETRISAQQKTFLETLSVLLDSMSTIQQGQSIDKTLLTGVIERLNLQIGFNTILAEKNLQSVLLTDEQIQQLNEFIKKASDLS